MKIKGRTYQPVHGKGWRDAEWQSVRVFVRAQGFGEDCWVESLGHASKKSGETADALRLRLLQGRDRADDMRLEALDF